MHNAARYALGAFAGAAIISGVGIGVAVAGNDSDPEPVAHVALAQENPVDSFIARLAGKLGIDEQTLRDAIEETLSEELDEAAAEGYLPQDLVDSLQEKIDEGVLEGDGELFGGDILPLIPGFEDIEAELEAFQERIAAFLGTTEEEIRRELESGKSLEEIAEAFDKTPQEIGQFLMQEYLSFLGNEDVPPEIRDGLREVTNRLIELYVEGDLTIDRLFDSDLFGEEHP